MFHKEKSAAEQYIGKDSERYSNRRLAKEMLKGHLKC